MVHLVLADSFMTTSRAAWISRLYLTGRFSLVTMLCVVTSKVWNQGSVPTETVGTSKTIHLPILS